MNTRTLRFLAATVLCWPLLATADVYADVDALIKESKSAEALAKADQHLAGNPRDPRMRLLKGVALASSGRAPEAIHIFTALTDDYPELPEPYNNLGVLYAGQGQFEQARAQFETALRTSPRFTAAYENLGDVHTRMAGQAYRKALGMDARNPRVGPKITLLNDLMAAANTPVAAAMSAAPSFGITMAAAQKFAQVAGAGAAAGAGQAVTSAPQQAAPAAQEDSANKEIQAAVEEWARAWSAKDIDAYFKAYSSEFQPQGQLTREAWSEQRRQRIEGKKRISVNVRGLVFAIHGEKAVVKFRQDYAADGLNASDRKTLELTRDGDRWVIVKEMVGS